MGTLSTLQRARGIIWATIYGLGCYFLGDNVHRLTGPIELITIAQGLLIIIASLIFVRRNERHLEEEAEHALPDLLYAFSSRSSGSRTGDVPSS